MEYLLRRWQKIERLIRDKKMVFLLLDYDGTLTPIKTRPELARLSSKTKELLERLADNPFFKLAIVSGRPLIEIKRLIGIKNIIYAGNHGLELEGPKVKFVNKRALLTQRLLDQLYQNLKKKLSGLKGTFVENKNLTLSVHFRLLRKRDVIRLKLTLDRFLKPWIAKKKIKVTYGKMVYEIRPPVNWDKGSMVNWLLRRHRISKAKILPICIGDDQTDEDMFKALGERGINISVGKPNPSSRARYYLRHTKEVKKFLSRLANLTK